jgi:hypothetical protein
MKFFTKLCNGPNVIYECGCWLCMVMQLPNAKWKTGLSISSGVENPSKMTPTLEVTIPEIWRPGHTGQAFEGVYNCLRMQCVKTICFGHPPRSPEHVKGHWSVLTGFWECWLHYRNSAGFSFVRRFLDSMKWIQKHFKNHNRLWKEDP